MAKSETSFPPGKSGNPKGRPPKNRTLTNILAKAGGKKILRDGKNVPARDVLAALLWQAITTGEVKFDSPDPAHQLPPRIIEPKDWVGLVRFVYGQIDGPPPAAVDVTSNGETVQGVTMIEINLSEESEDM